MTITEATHALARRARHAAAEPIRAFTARPMLFVDAMRRVEPTWVEAVAVVQTVCAQLTAGQAAPALNVLTLEPSGAVTFPAAGAGDDLDAVRALGQLLLTTLKGSVCPMHVWEAVERATYQPASFGSARAFGAALTALTSAVHGPRDLRAYYGAVTSSDGTDAREGLSAFARAGVAGRSVAVILLVVATGIGTGMSMGALLVTKALPVPTAMARADAPSPASR